MIIGTYDDGRVHVDIGRVPNECKVYIDEEDVTGKVHALTIEIRTGQVTKCRVEFAPLVSSKIQEGESSEVPKES